jgi:hypothetical protein
MKIFKTIVSDGQSILPVDTIEHEGKLWLVPLWIEDQDTKEKWPARRIQMDILAHKKLGPPQPWDFHLLDPIPKGVLDGTVPSKEAHGFVVVDSPAIRRPKGTAH